MLEKSAKLCKQNIFKISVEAIAKFLEFSYFIRFIMKASFRGIRGVLSFAFPFFLHIANVRNGILTFWLWYGSKDTTPWIFTSICHLSSSWWQRMYPSRKCSQVSIHTCQEALWNDYRLCILHTNDANNKRIHQVIMNFAYWRATD